LGNSYKLALYLNCAGRRDQRDHAAVLLDLVGLPSGLIDRYPHELSGGQRQRAGIARARALEPDFIVADEVVSGLDVSTQAHILLLLREMRARLGLTVVFISHDLSVVLVLCDDVAILQHGEVSNTVRSPGYSTRRGMPTPGSFCPQFHCRTSSRDG